LRTEPGFHPGGVGARDAQLARATAFAVLRSASALRVRGRAFGRRKWLLRRRG